jgi:hypothetical protein
MQPGVHITHRQPPETQVTYRSVPYDTIDPARRNTIAAHDRAQRHKDYRCQK